MRIATFNANSIRARLDAILDWMARGKPDVLCIQETKVQDVDFPVAPFEEAGYHVLFQGEKSYNGVAIVSCAKPTAFSFGLDDGGPRDETRLACAQFGAVRVVNTYIPQGREIEHQMYRYKLEWLGRLKAYFDRHFTPRMRVVWVGDMNVAQEAIDVHNAQQQKNHVCYHEDVRAAFADTVGWGFTDVLRTYHPEPGQYTFFDYRVPDAVTNGRGWRIDCIMATRSMARRCTDCFIDLEPRLLERPSDHTFLVADFDD